MNGPTILSTEVKIQSPVGGTQSTDPILLHHRKYPGFLPPMNKYHRVLGPGGLSLRDYEDVRVSMGRWEGRRLVSVGTSAEWGHDGRPERKRIRPGRP